VYLIAQGTTVTSSVTLRKHLPFLNHRADIPQVAATHRVINLNYSIHGALKQINAM
jgi:hypothetical protein